MSGDAQDDDPLELRPENDISELLRAILYERPYGVRVSNSTLREALRAGYVEWRRTPTEPENEAAWVMLGRDLKLTLYGLESLAEAFE
jgi:hypothetical protein